MNDNEKAKVRKLLGVVFTVLATVFFISRVINNFQDIPPINWNIGLINIFVLSVILIVISIGNNGLIWQRLLSDQGTKVSLKWTQAIFLITQFGKYLPGNVGQHLGRVYMAKQAGIPLAVTLNTILIEVVWSVGIGAGLALLSLQFFVDSKSLNAFLKINPAVLFLIFVILCFLPWLCIRIVNSFFPGFAQKYSGGDKILEPGLKTALIVGVQFIFDFLVMGVILYLQARWFFGHMGGNIIELTCLFSIAWIAGYIVPGAPAGMGIREAMMVFLLTPDYGSGLAIGLSITLRITTTLGDGLAFLIGFLIKWFNKGEQPDV